MYRLATWQHIVTATAPGLSNQPYRSVELPGYPDIPLGQIRVVNVLASAADATGRITTGADVDVAVHSARGEPFSDSYFVTAFAENPETTAILIPESTGAAAYVAILVVETPSGWAFEPPDCDFAGQIRRAMQRLDLEVTDLTRFLVDLQTAVNRRGPCEVADCDALLAALATPAPDPPNWYDLPPSERTVNMQEVPLEVLPNLALIGVAVSADDAVPSGVFTFSCELGRSVGWVTDAAPTFLPVSTCRESGLVLTFEPASGAPAIVATVPVETVLAAEENGLLVAVTNDAKGTPIAQVRLLADGEAESLTGMTTEQLERLRREYSGADRG